MQSVKRIASVLTSLGSEPRGVGVVDLSEQVNLPQSSLHRLLQSLCEVGLTWQDPTTKKYSLGIRLLEFGGPLLESVLNQKWRLHAHSALQELSIEFRKPFFLGVLVQNEVVVIESILPPSSNQTAVSIACVDHVPIHCGSSSKAILAFLPERDVKRIINHCTFRPYTMYTLATQQDLIKHLDEVRYKGFAMCNEEFSHGAYALSVPILDNFGCAFASLGLGPVPSYPNKIFMDTIISSLEETAKLIGKDYMLEQKRIKR
jgi:IclR family KDG regulon transcriptional repressor